MTDGTEKSPSPPSYPKKCDSNHRERALLSAAAGSGERHTSGVRNNYNFCSLGYISGNLDGPGAWLYTYFDGTHWNLEDQEDARGSSMWGGGMCMGLKLSHPMWFTGQYRWTVGSAPVAMMPTSEAVCALTLEGSCRRSLRRAGSVLVSIESQIASISSDPDGGAGRYTGSWWSGAA